MREAQESYDVAEAAKGAARCAADPASLAGCRVRLLGPVRAWQEGEKAAAARAASASGGGGGGGGGGREVAAPLRGGNALVVSYQRGGLLSGSACHVLRFDKGDAEVRVVLAGTGGAGPRGGASFASEAAPHATGQPASFRLLSAEEEALRSAAEARVRNEYLALAKAQAEAAAKQVRTGW